MSKTSTSPMLQPPCNGNPQEHHLVRLSDLLCRRGVSPIAPELYWATNGNELARNLRRAEIVCLLDNALKIIDEVHLENPSGLTRSQSARPWPSSLGIERDGGISAAESATDTTADPSTTADSSSTQQ